MYTLETGSKLVACWITVPKFGIEFCGVGGDGGWEVTVKGHFDFAEIKFQLIDVAHKYV